MTDPLSRLSRFFRELKRRNVYRVAVMYAVVAFAVWQTADLLFPALRFPAWTTDFVIVLTLLGFPVALVLAWAFEMTPEGVRRTPAAGGEAVGSGRGQKSRFAAKVLVGLGILAAAAAGGWYLTGGGGDSPEISERTVAVLPFQVSGAGAEAWRDGMVTMLSTGLDGAAGLRAIADQTVLAAWEQVGPTDATGGGSRSLATARRVGAEYAVIGQAVELGEELRLAVDVHETLSGDRVGQVEVEGSPEAAPALADSLTRRVLGLLLERATRDLPSVDLARLTTSDLGALKAFLRGERHFRDGRYEAAIEDYEAAVAEDSAFALAYARLARSHGWLDQSELADRHWTRAHELSGRLPPRERGLVHSGYLSSVVGRPLAAADTLRRLSEQYPDDPAVWYNLGETVFHGGIPRGWPGSESAFRRAVRLDPGMAPYHRHYVDLAFSVHHDSALAAERIEAFPDSARRRYYRRMWNLVFGREDRREAFFTWVDTASSADSVRGAFSGLQLGHPTDAGLRNRVLRRWRARDDVPDDAATDRVFVNEISQGHFREAFRMIENQAVPAPVRRCALTIQLSFGLPIPDSLVDRYLEPERLPSDPSLQQLACVGFSLIERGRSGEVDGILARMRARADTARPGGPSEDRVRRDVDGLRGYRAWKAGDLRRAEKLWSGPDRPPAPPIWRGDLYRELGELEKAEGWYLVAWQEPLAHQRLGQLYEEMREPEKAAEAYRRFIAAWEDADPELQDRVEAARGRLQKLTAREAESDD